ncbi:MAG TPA: hypothetical protein VLC09_18370, partial [Polyangiaceae bacterium]|nr:hypothetical protein [Polyangiaceae bacterium]
MRALLAALFVPLLGLGAVACEEASPPPPLAAGQLARVGELRITSDQLDELGATPAQLDRVRQDLERDLLLAQARGGLASPRGAAVERGWLGRALFEALMEEARAA